MRPQNANFRPLPPPGPAGCLWTPDEESEFPNSRRATPAGGFHRVAGKLNDSCNHETDPDGLFPVALLVPLLRLSLRRAFRRHPVWSSLSPRRTSHDDVLPIRRTRRGTHHLMQQQIVYNGNTVGPDILSRETVLAQSDYSFSYSIIQRSYFYKLSSLDFIISS